jgi:hypothetical protein
VYNFSDYLSPRTSVVATGMIYDVRCGHGRDMDGTAMLRVASWPHATSARRLGDAYYVAFRNLNAVARFAADGSGLDWLLSCDTGLASDFEPDDVGTDCFAAPHAIVPINATHVLLMDDGENRHGGKCVSVTAGGGGTPMGAAGRRDGAQEDGRRRLGRGSGETNADDGATFYVNCYSRAVMVELDERARRFRVVWSFAFGVNGPDAGGLDDDTGAATVRSEGSDVFQMAGGAVIPLPRDPANRSTATADAAAPGAPVDRVLVTFGALEKTNTGPGTLDDDEGGGGGDDDRGGDDGRARGLTATDEPATTYPRMTTVTRVFETDMEGVVHSEVIAPRPNWGDGDYRTVPIKSIGGETRQPHFAFVVL